MKVDTTLLPTGPFDQRAVAAHAESAGHDGVWAAEVAHDPLLMLALAATATERVDLGTAVALAFARNPMSLASAAHDLQGLSCGRLLLGLGTQVQAHITRRFGMPWSKPARRMREFVLALHAIWEAWETGDRLDFRGDFYEHTLMAPMFVPPPHGHRRPRVLLAGVGTAMTETAGEVADGFLCHAFTTERYIRDVTLPALRGGRGRELDDFTLVGTPIVTTGRTEEEYAEAVRRMRKQTAFYASTPTYRPVLALHGWEDLGTELHRLSREGAWDAMTALVDDEVLRTFTVVGEPDQIAPEIARRYGDTFTRCTLYTPYEADPGLMAQIASQVRKITNAETPTPALPTS